MWQCKSIFLNLTNFCNVRCKKCISLKVIRKRGELSKEILIKILNLFESHHFCGLIRCGVGENLIYSHLDYLMGQLFDVKKKFRFDILTNGLAFPLDKEFYYTNPSVRWGVTLDGMTQDDIKGLQSGLDVELVKKKLFQIKKRYPTCNMYLNYTLHNNNLNHLIDFIKMGIDLNVNQIFVTPLKVFENHYTEFLSKYIPNLSLSSTISLFSEVKKIANQYCLKLNLPGNTPAPIPCALSGNYSPIIDIDGMVSFCSGRENVKIGNITNSAIDSIWSKVKEKTVIKSQLSNFCKNCLNINNFNKHILSVPSI